MQKEKLVDKIKESGFSNKDVAISLGMNESTFYRKLNRGGDTFTLKEVGGIIKMLNLTGKEAGEIFFEEKLA